MTKLANLVKAAAIVAPMLIATQAVAGAEPTGVWMDDTGRGAIEIAPCEKGLCGHVVWVKDATDTKKGCGKQIIGDVKDVGGGRWDNGWIYSPEKRRNYDVELKPLDNGNLRVTGYAGVRFLSKTMIWKPAPADLVRCSSDEAKPAAAKPVEQIAKVEAPAVGLPSEPPAKAAPAPAASVGSGQAAGSAAPVTKVETKPEPRVEPAPDQQASRDDDDGGQDRGGGLAERLGKLKIGGLDLDKVLSRDGGTCKLDLPWVKVKFDCDR